MTYKQGLLIFSIFLLCLGPLVSQESNFEQFSDQLNEVTRDLKKSLNGEALPPDSVSQLPNVIRINGEHGPIVLNLKWIRRDVDYIRAESVKAKRKLFMTVLINNIEGLNNDIKNNRFKEDPTHQEMLDALKRAAENYVPVPPDLGSEWSSIIGGGNFYAEKIDGEVIGFRVEGAGGQGNNPNSGNVTVVSTGTSTGSGTFNGSGTGVGSGTRSGYHNQGSTGRVTQSQSRGNVSPNSTGSTVPTQNRPVNHSGNSATRVQNSGNSGAIQQSSQNSQSATSNKNNSGSSRSVQNNQNSGVKNVAPVRNKIPRQPKKPQEQKKTEPEKPKEKKDSGLLKMFMKLMYWFIVLLTIVMAVLIIVYLVRTIRKNLKPEHPDILVETTSLPEERSPPDTLYDKALKAAAKGDFEDGIRLLTMASLILLDEKRVVGFDSSRTNGEYLVSLVRKRGLFSLLKDPLRLFDRLIYGEKPAGKEEFEVFRMMYKKLEESKDEAA